MWPFTHFWLDCFHIGWHLADGLSNILGTIAGLIAGYLAWKKRHEHKKIWEDFAVKAMLGIFVLAFLFSTVCVAPYIQYKEEREKREKMEQERKSISCLPQKFVNDNP